MVELLAVQPEKDSIRTNEQELCQTTQTQEITVVVGFPQRGRSDFESAASASSAIPARVDLVSHNAESSGSQAASVILILNLILILIFVWSF